MKTSLISGWERFYKKYFGLDVEFGNVIVPAKSGDYDRVIFIPAGLTCVEVVNASEKLFQVDTSITDLDTKFKSIRTTEKSYAIRLEEKTFSYSSVIFSTKRFSEKTINSATLLERLVYGLKYFLETKQHLDTDEAHGVTYCVASFDPEEYELPVVKFNTEKNQLEIFTTAVQKTNQTYFGRKVRI
jgi:hypothetical protein